MVWNGILLYVCIIALDVEWNYDIFLFPTPNWEYVLSSYDAHCQKNTVQNSNVNLYILAADIA